MIGYRKVVIAGAALTVSGAIAFAAGNWSTLPQVGESSFCASTVTGIVLPTPQGPFGVVPGSTQGTGSSICGQTVPAGPAALTGTEIIPADTQLSGSAPPQTVTIPIVLFDAGAYTYTSWLNTLGASPSTLTIPNNTSLFLLDPTGTVTSLTLYMPSAPLNGQMIRIASTHTITNLLLQAATVNGALNATIENSPTILTASTTGPFNYDYIYSTTAINGPLWIRVQ
jgi:hypothetical protein